MVRSIGADHVVDYTRADFTEGDERYDVILDNVKARSLSDTRRALTPTGTLIPNGAPVGGWFGGLGSPIAAFASSLFVRRQARPFVSTTKTADLLTLGELAESGKIAPVIDKSFPLAETAEAVAYVGEGHTRGKTIITVDHAGD